MLSLSLSSPDDISAADRGSMEQSVSGFFFFYLLPLSLGLVCHLVLANRSTRFSRSLLRRRTRGPEFFFSCCNS